MSDDVTTPAAHPDAPTADTAAAELPAVAETPAVDLPHESPADLPDEPSPEADDDDFHVPVEAAEPVATAEPGAANSEPPPDGSAEPAAPAEPPSNKKWYIIKVTSGREESIKAAIERRVKIEGLEEFFGQIHIPVERVTEVKKIKETRNGEKITKEKRVIKEKKKFPGYLMAEVEFNEDILYLFRETSGVGDFVGATGPLKPPPPMTDIEVRRMLGEALGPDDKKDGKTVVKLDYEKGDRVRIREGAFANMEGEVKVIVMPKEAGETPKVTVEVTIFGRGVPVDLEYWQVDKV